MCNVFWWERIVWVKSVNLFFYVENGKLGWVLLLYRLILLSRYNIVNCMIKLRYVIKCIYYRCILVL